MRGFAQLRRCNNRAGANFGSLNPPYATTGSGTITVYLWSPAVGGRETQGDTANPGRDDRLDEAGVVVQFTNALIGVTA
jgi:hypothetical protein